MFGKLNNSGFARILAIITAMLVCLMPWPRWLRAIRAGTPQQAGGTLEISVGAQGDDAGATYTVTITSATAFEATVCRRNEQQHKQRLDDRTQGWSERDDNRRDWQLYCD